MKNNLIRKLIGGLSLTSAVFIFQACYGTPQDFMPDLLIEGQVKSSTSGLPIKGIKVSVADDTQYEMTDNDGKFSFYTELIQGLTVKFQDIDNTENGLFFDKDTVLTDVSREVYLEIAMEEK